jgi:uncharacterized repeat protein (TIGR01451 family)
MTALPAVTAPSDGVVVRWRVKSASTSAPGARLRMLRPVGGGSYVTAGSSAVQTIPSGTSTFSTRIPVNAGDVLGLDEQTGAKVFGAATSAAYFFQPFLGDTTQAPDNHLNGRELLVNADIEPDADGDGYGDETQDLCPGDPSRHTACLANLSLSVSPAPAPLLIGKTLTFTVKVANGGPSAAQDVGLTLNLPLSATPLAVRTGRGTCGGAYTITCQLGAIPANDVGTVILAVRPEAVGTLVLSASTATSTTETSTDDNTFTSDVTVLPPNLRLLNLRLSQSVIHVGGRLAIKWYETDSAAVTIKLEQITRRGRHLPFGAYTVPGHPGSNAILFKGRIPHRKRLKPGSYRFTVSAATLDGRVATPGMLGFAVRRKHHS